MLYFNPLKIKLKNSNLIEASAGTGKTHIISILYLRFLFGINLEKCFSCLSLSKILIVTFTDLATLEIKNRIRTNIENLRISCMNNFCINSEIKGLFNVVKNIPNIVNILFMCEYQIDIASIFTIHGFCKKILFTSFFSSNINLNFKILNSESDLIYKLVVSFWRKYFYPLSIDLIKIIITYWSNPKDLYKFIFPFFNHIVFNFNYINNFLSINDCYIKMIIFIDNIKKKWILEKENIYNLLISLNLNKYIYNKKNISNWIEKLDIWANVITVDFVYPICLLRFSGEYLFKICNEVCFLKKNSFFNDVDKFFLYKNNLFNFIVVSCFNYVKNQIKKQKIKKSLLSFNDLVIYLYESLKKDYKNVLINSITNNYPIILIDEFQDTDFLQYEIFHMIYIKNVSNINTKLILIGDIKQLIYTFRGASIFTYIKARNDVDCLYTFNCNWRSSYGLIKGINYLFNRIIDPFFFKEIKYISFDCSKKSKSLFFIKNNLLDFAINFYLFKKKINFYNYKELLAKYCANNICKLLNECKSNYFSVDGKSLNRNIVPSDISILVYSNTEAKIIFDVFSDFNLPIDNSFINSNIFHTLEAKEIMFVLKSILFPESRLNMRNALFTFIFGFDLYIINEFLNDKNKLDSLVDEFHFYYDIWINYGIFSMIKYLVYRRNLVSRMFHLNKKQYIINIIHISEILQKVSLSFESEYFLLDWLNNQIYNSVSNIAEYFIRSYYDDVDTIKITTIHKSKGLQYNIVYLPFLINLNSNNYYYYFYDKNNNNVKIDLLKCKENKKKHEKELFSEEMRLLYVAITRSVYQCNIFIYDVKKKSNKRKFFSTSIGKLFFLNKKKNFVDIENFLFLHFKCKYVKFYFLDDIKFNNDIFFINKDILSHVEVVLTKENKFKFTNIGLFNYTNIVLNNKSSFNQYLNFTETDDVVLKKDNINYFPKGDDVGRFFHILLENIDFKKDIDVEFLVNKIDEFHYNNDWLNVIKDSLFNILNVNLDLINICISSKKIFFYYKEFDFLLLIKNSFSFSKYNEIIKKYDSISKLCNDIYISGVLSGFLNGFIDLIFVYESKYYIIDYKSNWLGYNYEDYNINNLLKIISHYRYDIQYQIYTVALHNYLKLNLINYRYDFHFGGIYYLFIRGLNLDNFNKSKNGVFFIKPSYLLINKLSILINGK